MHFSIWPPWRFTVVAWKTGWSQGKTNACLDEWEKNAGILWPDVMQNLSDDSVAGFTYDSQGFESSIFCGTSLRILKTWHPIFSCETRISRAERLWHTACWNDCRFKHPKELRNPPWRRMCHSCDTTIQRVGCRLRSRHTIRSCFLDFAKSRGILLAHTTQGATNLYSKAEWCQLKFIDWF